MSSKLKQPFFSYLFSQFEEIRRGNNMKFRTLERVIQPKIAHKRSRKEVEANIFSSKRIKFKSSLNKKTKIFEEQKKYLIKYDITNETTIKQQLLNEIPISYTALHLNSNKVNWRKFLPFMLLLIQALLEIDINEPNLLIYVPTLMVKIINFKSKNNRDKLPLRIEELMIEWNVHLIKNRIIISFLWEHLIISTQDNIGVSSYITKLEDDANNGLNADYKLAIEKTKFIPVPDFDP
ncbi:hypothetical protein K502DRAFT_367060 [Neoconidiobolus thromboides FSU 785]|nr:hypothetical protein K502DRAFT_367060 [Neoconidiobolus thromboides FSU 785]